MSQWMPLGRRGKQCTDQFPGWGAEMGTGLARAGRRDPVARLLRLLSSCPWGGGTPACSPTQPCHSRTRFFQGPTRNRGDSPPALSLLACLRERGRPPSSQPCTSPPCCPSAKPSPWPSRHSSSGQPPSSTPSLFFSQPGPGVTTLLTPPWGWRAGWLAQRSGPCPCCCCCSQRRPGEGHFLWEGGWWGSRARATCGRERRGGRQGRRGGRRRATGAAREGKGLGRRIQLPRLFLQHLRLGWGVGGRAAPRQS